MFNLIGLGEHAGSGVPDIFKAWSDAGLNEPVVEEKFGSGNPDRTILTLPLVSREESLAISGKQPEKSPEKQPKLTRKEIIERRIEDVLALIMVQDLVENVWVGNEITVEFKADSMMRIAEDELVG